MSGNAPFCLGSPPVRGTCSTHHSPQRKPAPRLVGQRRRVQGSRHRKPALDPGSLPGAGGRLSWGEVEVDPRVKSHLQGTGLGQELAPSPTCRLPSPRPRRTSPSPARPAAARLGTLLPPGLLSAVFETCSRLTVPHLQDRQTEGPWPAKLSGLTRRRGVVAVK